MRRFRMGLLGRAVGVWLALMTAAAGQAVIDVSDSDSHGTLGDSDLSLEEAIQLANGDLDKSNLSAQEQTYVVGCPGAGVADRIQFSFCCFPGTINVTQTLSPLKSGMDTLDGSSGGRYNVGQIVLDCGGSSEGVTITGSGTTVQVLEVRDADGACIEVSAPSGGSVENVTIVDCRVADGDFGIRVRAPSGGASTVGSMAQPVSIIRTAFDSNSDLGATSRGLIVSGGTGDGNQIHVQVSDCTGTTTGGGGVDIIGGEGGADTGDNNDVHVEISRSSFDRGAFGRPSIGARVRGATTDATASTGNSVSVGLHDVLFVGFRSGSMLAEGGAGSGHQVDVDAVLGRLSNTETNLEVRDGDGSNHAVDVRFTGVEIENGGTGNVVVQGTSSGAGNTVSLTAINCTISGGGRGVSVATDQSATLDVDLSDNCISDHDAEGLLVSPDSATASYRVRVNRNAFRGNGDGVVIGAGSPGDMTVDLGGGSLASRGGNTFSGSAGCGVFNNTTIAIRAESNNWGDATGPSDCEPGSDGDGIGDPSGNGDGVSEYVYWSPFVTYDQNPKLTVTGGLDPVADVTILVEHGVPGSSYLLLLGFSMLDPPADTGLGNFFYLDAPVLSLFVGTVGTPIGPITPPGGLGGLELTFQAGVFQGPPPGEWTNAATLR